MPYCNIALIFRKDKKYKPHSCQEQTARVEFYDKMTDDDKICCP